MKTIILVISLIVVSGCNGFVCIETRTTERYDGWYGCPGPDNTGYYSDSRNSGVIIVERAIKYCFPLEKFSLKKKKKHHPHHNYEHQAGRKHPVDDKKRQDTVHSHGGDNRPDKKGQPQSNQNNNGSSQPENKKHPHTHNHDNSSDKKLPIKQPENHQPSQGKRPDNDPKPPDKDPKTKGSNASDNGSKKH